MNTAPLSRRHLIKGGAAALATLGLQTRISAADQASGLKGKVNHSVCKWCYNNLSLDELCAASKKIGIVGIDLLGVDDFATLKKYDLSCSLASHPSIKGPAGYDIGGITKSVNRIEHHDLLVQAYEPWLKACAEAGVKQSILFSGNREGMDDETGLKNSIIGVKKLLPLAEKYGVTLVMELLNSRPGGHVDYMCDKSAWGIALSQAVSSEKFKLLYDIYHMQIMEGNVIATIRENHQHFSHYHTGGVPGRHEIDESQELNYPAIMKAIVETGYKGYVAQEFIPAKPDTLASLHNAIKICDV